MNTDYIDINRKFWNDRLDSHVESEFYDNDSFIQGANSLNAPELELLGDITGKSVLHLQCHFGQDSISMSRMGAHVTGVDLSDKAIDFARKLAEECKEEVDFVCSDILSLKEKIDEKYDIVFTTYGTIGWLPDLDKWASVVSHFLKEGGKFVFVEFHPVVWMFDDDFNKVTYSYLHGDAIVEDSEGSYASPDSGISSRSVSWNHGLSEVFTALQKQGIQIKSFKEELYSPYDCFRNTVEVENGKFQIKGMEGKLPMIYSLLGAKP